MSKRGRTSLSDKILKEVSGDPKIHGTEISLQEGSFLVTYDHAENPSAYFYKNLDRILASTGDGVKLQNSLLACEQLRTAVAVHRLATHYGARSQIYRAVKLEV